MKKIILLIMVLNLKSFSQNIPFESIWDNSLKPKLIQSIKPTSKPQFYTTLREDKDIFYIEKFNYKTSKKEETIFSSINYNEIKKLSSYIISKTENKILLVCNVEPIYRHSFYADYFIFDLKTKKIKKVDESKIQEATFSPDEKYIAYVKNNNIHYFEIENSKIFNVTYDGQKNKIINGISDWVYEEELQIVKTFSWNNSSDKIIFLKFDESQVEEMSLDIFGEKPYPEDLRFKYPKAGEKNSDVSVHIFDIKSQKIENISFDIVEELYFPRIYPYKEDKFAIMVLNRKQNSLKIISLENEKKILFSEQNETYIDIPQVNFIEEDFIISSEKDGFNHLYHYKDGKELKQITEGNWEIINLYGYDKNTKNVFFQSNISGAKNQVLNMINIEGGDIKYLSSKEGINTAYFNSDFTYYIKVHSDDKTPNVYTLEDLKKEKTIKIIESNRELLETSKKYSLQSKEFIEIELEKDIFVDAYLLKPNNFDKNKKYPLLIYVYGGPGSRQVYDNWSTDMMLYLKYLASKGYIVAVTETRGTGGKGQSYKKVTQNNLGKYEIIDLINIGKKLGSYDYIDEKRIGTFGWSYGGYMSSLAITKGADVFSLSIAVAPVTDWRYYNTIYTERYLGTPQQNPNGYNDNSPLNFVENITGKYLLIHGSADDNVHHQNSMVMARKLIEIDKPFEFFVYPNKDHGIKGGKTRSHLFKKITNFIENNL